MESLNPLALYSKETLEFVYTGVPIDVTYSTFNRRNRYLGQSFTKTVHGVMQEWPPASRHCVMLIQFLCKCAGVVQPKGYTRGQSFKSVHMVLLYKAAWNDHLEIAKASVGAQVLYFLRWFVAFPFQKEWLTVDVDSFAVARRSRREASGKEFGEGCHGAVIVPARASNPDYRSWNVCSNTRQPNVEMFQQIMDELAVRCTKADGNMCGRL